MSVSEYQTQKPIFISEQDAFLDVGVIAEQNAHDVVYCQHFQRCVLSIAAFQVA